ncbi:VOC family protein [Thermobaculum terrenum]|uniref:VOC family protein n=1 Tax=Thermobaculum terrenum TaxID=166501 RepID=UPI000675FE85
MSIIASLGGEKLSDVSALGPIVQVGMVVKDIEKAARRWAALLGSPMPEVIVTAPWEQAHTEYRGAPTPARAKLAFFHLGQVDLELIEPIDGPSTWQDHLQTHGESIHHVAFRVQDMEEVIAALEAKGLSLLQRGDYTGGRYAYLEDSGAIIELLEDLPTSP